MEHKSGCGGEGRAHEVANAHLVELLGCLAEERVGLVLLVENLEGDVLLLLEGSLTLGLFELEDARLALFLSLSALYRVAILVDWHAGTALVLLLLDHLDLLITRQRIPLHAVPHAIRLIVDIVNTIAIHFGPRVNYLSRSNPLFIVLLLPNEVLHVVYLTEVVHFKRVFRIDFLKKFKQIINWST